MLISTSWPGTDWSDPAWGWFETEELATEINFQLEGEVESLMLLVRGGIDPVLRVCQLCADLGAVAIDTSTGDLLGIDAASSGYPGWLQYRNRFVGQQRREGEH